jgi:hypothetical protein
VQELESKRPVLPGITLQELELIKLHRETRKALAVPRAEIKTQIPEAAYIELTKVSTGKQDHGICFIVYPLTSSFLLSCKTLDAFARVSDVHQSILCFEIQFCFKLARISSELKHRHEYART